MIEGIFQQLEDEINCRHERALQTLSELRQYFNQQVSDVDKIVEETEEIEEEVSQPTNITDNGSMPRLTSRTRTPTIRSRVFEMLEHTWMSAEDVAEQLGLTKTQVVNAINAVDIVEQVQRRRGKDGLLEFRVNR